MTIYELKKECADLVKKLDIKFNINRDPQLCFTQMMEEIGELAKEVNRPRLRNKAAEIEDLNGEFADVLIQLLALANMHEIEIEEVILSKIESTKVRYLN